MAGGLSSAVGTVPTWVVPAIQHGRLWLVLFLWKVLGFDSTTEKICSVPAQDDAQIRVAYDAACRNPTKCLSTVTFYVLQWLSMVYSKLPWCMV